MVGDLDVRQQQNPSTTSQRCASCPFVDQSPLLTKNAASLCLCPCVCLHHERQQQRCCRLGVRWREEHHPLATSCCCCCRAPTADARSTGLSSQRTNDSMGSHQLSAPSLVEPSPPKAPGEGTPESR